MTPTSTTTPPGSFPTADSSPSSSPSSSARPGDSPLTAESPRSGEMLDRMVRGAHQGIDRMAESAAPHLSRLEENMHGASDALHAKSEHWREVGDEWTESVRSSVREHPLAAVGIALVAGMLIARMTR